MRGVLEFVLFWVAMVPLLYGVHLLRAWTHGNLLLTAAVCIPLIVLLAIVGVTVDIRRGHYRLRDLIRSPARALGLARGSRKSG